MSRTDEPTWEWPTNEAQRELLDKPVVVERARRWLGMTSAQIVAELSGRLDRTRACGVRPQVADRRRRTFLRCTLPAGHGHWHEYADPDGEVLLIWADEEADFGAEFPYKQDARLLTGPYQTDRLGRVG